MFARTTVMPRTTVDRSLPVRASVSRLAFVAGSVLLLSLAFGVASSAAGTAWWHLSSNVRPASIAPNGEGTIIARAVNVGDGLTVGPASLSDVVPAGYKIVEEEIEGEMVPKVSFVAFSHKLGNEDLTRARDPFFNQPLELCSVSGQRVSCQTESPNPALKIFKEPPFNELEPPFKELVELGIGVPPLEPFEDLELRIAVENESAASGALNEAEVNGGAPAARLGRGLPVSSMPPSFGVEDFSLVPEEEGGGVDVQAGSHPSQLTTEFALNQGSDLARPPALPRNLKFNLPAGLIGNATLLAQCSDLDFRHVVSGGEENLCSAETAVGVASVTVDEPVNLNLITFPVPLFNLVPAKGGPARFGFEIAGAPVTLDTSVRTGSDYGVSVSVNNITQLTSFISSTVTFWGVPGDPSHDSARGWSCLVSGHWTKTTGRDLPCIGSNQSHPAPFLTMPTSCALPFTASVEGVSWSSPGAPALPLPKETYGLSDSFGRALGLSGCNRLAFAPAIEAQPDVSSASTPTGLAVHVRVPQEVSLGANGLASSSIKDTTVVLPEGVSVNPSGSDGLQACSEGLAGFEGIADGSSPLIAAGTDLFTSTLPNPLEQGVNFCPDAAKIGTVEFKVPVIEHPLKGSVYIAQQNQNPFGSLVAMYIVAQDPEFGVLLKLAGEVSLSATGQLTTVLKNSPQAPLEEATFSFFGGERAPLSTPSRCGSYTTQAVFTPWSETAPVSASSTFQIATGPNGSPCPGAALPFSPSLTGGTTNISAGAFSPLTTTIGRADGQQDMQSVTLHMPPGLSGLLTGVKLCAEAQANDGTCGPESLIGETTVSAGVGSDPVSVKGGKVYLTEKYGGAPFGLSIVNPVKAGPFDLEHDTANPAQQPGCDCIVVRAKIEVDPVTAALTVTTDPSGPHAIPSMLDGIPVQIQHVNVLVNRPGFTFNPTNCDPMQITGSIASDEGSSSPVSVPFQVTNCKDLAFKPSFKVSTSGKTSKKTGASLHVKLTYPKAAFGSQANIASVKVSLPKQLPTSLKAIQHACPHQVFEADPAGCSSISKVGFAKATTPLLPVQLEGPAYFVSYGGAKFPELVIVLQGYGVTVDLHGETFIDEHTNITSSTFKTVPDVPVGTFELTLPEGSFSALAAPGGSLCSQALTMPTAFTAQNGATLKRSTPIEVQGCPYALRIARRSVSNRTLTLKVSVPQAGKLTAKGRGVSGTSKTASGRQMLTLTLKELRAGRLRTSVLLRFTPAKGRQRKILRKSITVTFG
jgi:hypothetical protein